jgi:hypothetical protein
MRQMMRNPLAGTSDCMFWLFSGSLCLLWCGVAAGDAPAAGPGADRPLARWIEQLGSDDFATREAAGEQLLRAGSAALEALTEAAAHPDREIRFRAQRLLGLIQQHDLEQRLERFLSAKPGQEEALPGWRRFKARYGDLPGARAVFVEMQRADAALLAALEEGSAAAARLLAQRAVQYQQFLQAGGQQLTLGQIAAALFVAGEEDVMLSSQTATILFSHCHQAAVRDALSGAGRGELPRMLIGAVVRRSDDEAAYSAMTVAFRYDLPDGIVAAERVLKGQIEEGPTRSTHMAQYALMTLARLGGPAHLPLVEKLLGDTALVTRMQENQTVYDVQLRDAALAAAVVLSGQPLGKYFDVPPNQPLDDLQVVFFNPRIIGFASEEKRAAVFAKWARQRAANKTDLDKP